MAPATEHAVRLMKMRGVSQKLYIGKLPDDLAAAAADADDDDDTSFRD